MRHRSVLLLIWVWVCGSNVEQGFSQQSQAGKYFLVMGSTA